MRIRRQPFSLIELVVVMAIGLLLLGVGALALRPRLSEARRLDQLGRELLNFCARVRVQAMSSGEERRIVLDPENRQLRATVVVPEDEAEESLAAEQAADSGSSAMAELKWKLPDGVNLELPETGGAAELEVFRFFPDGAGAGEHELTLKLGTRERTVAISRLTGMVRLTEARTP